MTDHGLPSGCVSNSAIAKAANAELEKQFGVSKLIKQSLGYTYYINTEAIDSAGLDYGTVTRAACKALMKSDEIEWAVDVLNIDSYPLPTILKERIKLGYFPGRSGEIYVVPRTGFYSGSTNEAGSNHGTWSQSDSHIPLIFMGWHITPGETSRLTHMTDIAATVCAMLHIQAPNGCIGKPIFE